MTYFIGLEEEHPTDLVVWNHPAPNHGTQGSFARKLGDVPHPKRWQVPKAD